MSITSREFVAHVRALVGTRWVHQGRSHSGVDCIGLVVVSAESAGIDLEQYGVEDPRGYSRNPNPALLKKVENYCEQLEAPVCGCLILFQFPHELAPQHFGIYTDSRTVIHADAKRGRVVEHGYRAQWVKWTHSLWKVPGVVYE